MILKPSYCKFFYLAFVAIQILSACSKADAEGISKDVSTNVSVNLTYELKEYLYDGSGVSENNLSGQNENSQIRYIVRAYPVSKGKVSSSFTKEVVANKSVGLGFNNNISIDLPTGEYELMIWSDIVENGHIFHNAANFEEISLQGIHEGNNPNRDAFRGSSRIVVKDSDMNCTVKMERPLARFNLISDDLFDFISRQSEDNPSVDLDDYSVVVSYVGYMPSAYSMIADKAVDASTGVQFNSSCEQVNDSEVFLGYDYVFANESNTAVTIQVALFDKIGKCVSSSKSVKVNLRRNHCTILKGKFMSSDSSDGIKIETKYDGSYNIKL